MFCADRLLQITRADSFLGCTPIVRLRYLGQLFWQIDQLINPFVQAGRLLQGTSHGLPDALLDLEMLRLLLLFDVRLPARF